MNRPRLALLGVAASAALLFTSACSLVEGVTEGVEQASNTLEVCNSTIDTYNKHDKAIGDAVTALQTAAPDKAPAALETFNATVKTEMTALHTALQEQAGKAKADAVKKAIESLDTQVAVLTDKPEMLTTDEKFADSLNGSLDLLSKACDAEREKPAK